MCHNDVWEIQAYENCEDIKPVALQCHKYMHIRLSNVNILRNKRRVRAQLVEKKYHKWSIINIM